MSNRRDLQNLRRAQQQAKRQLRQLAKLELTGLTAVTLHAHTRQVTITLTSATGGPFTDTLREILRERRQTLQAKAQHLLLTWLEDEQLDHSAPAAGSPSPRRAPTPAKSFRGWLPSGRSPRALSASSY